MYPQVWSYMYRLNFFLQKPPKYCQLIKIGTQPSRLVNRLITAVSKRWKVEVGSWKVGDGSFEGWRSWSFLGGSRGMSPQKILKINSQKGPISCILKASCWKKVVFYHSSNFWVFLHNQYWIYCYMYVVSILVDNLLCTISANIGQTK